MSRLSLTKDTPSISFDKSDITGSGEIVIETTWHRTPSGMDLDAGLMAKQRGGRNKTAIQALGRNFGSKTRFPFFELSGDDRSGGTGETITGTYSTVLQHVDWFGAYLYNYGSDTHLDQVPGAQTVIRFPGMRDIVLVHEDMRGTAGALLQVFNEGGSFRIQRDLVPFSAHHGKSVQKQIDTFWGVGLNWRPASK